MTILEKTDLTLKMLYTTFIENGGKGGIYPIPFFEDNDLSLTEEELDEIIFILKEEGLIVSQVSHQGKRIYFDSLNKGVDFVETNSFSQPGTSILDI